MSFNPDPQKQAVELIFSMKRSEMNHPEIRFNNIPVMKVDEHKHLGIIQYSRGFTNELFHWLLGESGGLQRLKGLRDPIGFQRGIFLLITAHDWLVLLFC